MRLFFSAIMFANAVLSFYFCIRIVYYKHVKAVSYRDDALAVLASAVWSLGQGVMYGTADLLTYRIFRIVGMCGLVMFMILGKVCISLLNSTDRRFKWLIYPEAIAGITIIAIAANPSMYTVEQTAEGIVATYTSGAFSLIYTIYCVIITGLLFPPTIRMCRHRNPARIRSTGKSLLVVESIIGLGMIVDTVLPVFGIDFHIPASSILQFGGLVIFRHAIVLMDQNTINLENMSEYIYESIQNPILVFTPNHELRLANRKAREIFDLPSDDNFGKEYDFWLASFGRRREEFSLYSDRDITMKLFYPKKELHLNLNFAPIFDIYRELIGYIVVAMDVTEQFRNMEEAARARQSAEMAIREAEHANEMAEIANRTNNMKSDFLANMSHEIRTPMNAIIGMAEMSLRTALPSEAVDYISQIKSSGTALLNIINDILDFSKIEAGKMEIIDEEYEVLSNIHDVGNILMTRLRDKDVELLTTVSPDLPCRLSGDYLRLRQVLINLANNAIKFTKQGYVRVRLEYEKIDDENIRLIFHIRDTGIGIAPEDLGKLFESFQQIDSKRNRAVEGTGLGLAISKRLVSLMNGEISVQSEYGVGSEFSFWVPQKVIDWTPCVSVPQKDKLVAVGYFEKQCLARQFFGDINLLGVDSIALGSLDKFETALAYNRTEIEGKEILFYTESDIYDNKLSDFVNAHPEINFVVFRSFGSVARSDRANVRFAKKPLSTILIGMTLNNDVHSIRRDDSAMEFDFVAPNAKVLIVDDNEVNLSVAEGLLKPLEMQITTALNGKKALEYIDHDKFDIVFMDHMMPELDGVEVTRIIRKLHPELSDMPIIALTANAVGEARNMFLAEGMNDFVAKPIELRTLTAKIRKWLPEDKIRKSKNRKSVEDTAEAPVIGDLDVSAALKLIGSRDIFFTILEKFYQAIEKKAKIILESEHSEDITTYTIEVHALKSAARQIGAMSLSESAALLEQAGNRNDIAEIHKSTPMLLEKYLSYRDVIRPFVKESQEISEKLAVDVDLLRKIFSGLRTACEDLNLDAMEELTDELGKFDFDHTSIDFYTRMKEAVTNVDSFSCVEILDAWEREL